MPQCGNRAARADAPRRHGGPRRDAAGARSNHAAGRPPRGPFGDRGQPGGGPADGAGPDRGETRRGGGTGGTPLPCRTSRQPRKARIAETGLAAAAGNGTPQPPLRTAARRASRASLQPRLRVCGIPEGTRIAHHNSATPRPPRVRGAVSVVVARRDCGIRRGRPARDGAHPLFQHIADYAEQAVDGWRVRVRPGGVMPVQVAASGRLVASLGEPFPGTWGCTRLENRPVLPCGGAPRILALTPSKRPVAARRSRCSRTSFDRAGSPRPARLNPPGAEGATTAERGLRGMGGVQGTR